MMRATEAPSIRGGKVLASLRSAPCFRITGLMSNRNKRKFAGMAGRALMQLASTTTLRRCRRRIGFRFATPMGSLIGLFGCPARLHHAGRNPHEATAYTYGTETTA